MGKIRVGEMRGIEREEREGRSGCAGEEGGEKRGRWRRGWLSATPAIASGEPPRLTSGPTGERRERRSRDARGGKRG